MDSIRYFYKKVHVLAIFCCIAVLFLLMGCNFEGSISSNSSEEFKAAEPGNYTDMGWLEGYDAFHKQISAQYAFGEWKDIDWENLNEQIRPQVVQAEQDDSESEYATALLEYTRALPDGHVSLAGENLLGLIVEHISGSYGLAVTGLDDGRIIANIVIEDGEAAQSGLEVGDEILKWNGLPISEALEQVSTLWRMDTSSLATEEYTLLEKYRMLVLDPVNTQSEIRFTKNGSNENSTVILTAIDDGGEIFTKTEIWNKVNPDDLVQYDILESGYGYILIGALESDNITLQEISEKFKEVMQYMTSMDVPGLIIDLRGNGGGSDNLAAEIAGYFYSEKTFYEYQSYYNKLSGKFEIILANDEEEVVGKNIGLYIEPQTPYYSGPVVAIVNPMTVSSAEGIAMAIKNLPQGYVVSFYGSNGSFGMTGGQSLLPEGYLVSFPFGRSLDEDKIIQIDSKNGVGGVVPDIRIPMTTERAIKFAEGEDVELEYAVDILQQM